MYIRCPNCGRKGHLPDHLAPEANSLRCRRCRANFPTPELARLAPARDETSASVPAEAFSGRGGAQGFLNDGYFRGYDTEPARQLGPGDSNYELIFTLEDTGGDLDDDWEANPAGADTDTEEPSLDDIPAVAAARGLDPWHHRFIESWGLICVGAAIAMIALMVPIEGYLIWQSFRAESATALPAIVGGLACATALLLVSVPLLLLATSLPELVRDIRGLRERLERKA